MNATAEIYGHALVLKIKGELNEDSLDAFRQMVQHHMRGDEVIDLVLDLENVPFIDSAALEFMVDLQARLAERFGQVKLTKCDENIRKILEITRLEGNFEVFDETPEAVKTIRP